MILPAALLLLGAALRLWFVLRHSVIQGDSNLYSEIAQNWVQAHTYGFSTDTDYIRPTLIRLPGYPIFLVFCRALFSHWVGPDSFVPAMLLQVFLDLASCVLIACTVRSLLQSRMEERIARRGFLLVLAISCLCPFTANYTATPLAEPLVLFTISAAIYSLERWNSVFRSTGKSFNRYLYLLAASLASSLLLRPDQALLAAALLPALLWMNLYPQTKENAVAPPVVLADALESRLRRRLYSTPLKLPTRSVFAPAIVVLLLTLLPLVPWTIRNERTFHVFQPIAPHYATDPGEPIDLGFQRWYRSWAIDFASTEYFYWKYPDEPIDIAQLPDRAFDSEAQYDQTADLIADSNNAVHFHRDIDARFNQLAQERIAANPLRYYVLLPVARLGNMLFHPRTELLPYDLIWWRYRWHHQQTLISWAFALLNLAYIVAAVYAWPRLRALSPPLAWAVLAFFLLRCCLLLTLDNAEQRYTMEFYPLFFLLIPLLLLRVRPEHREPAVSQ
ncbi:hypothetical protein AciPR4_0958 [Terriglobus saanensis SP1PR4]|uniref:Glycosyltransferase RgtA/B/C/D-like domain-containing protein n=2 Tax=Terriglobus saanensis TaxID=870903 RepID=E8V888_TERSS|nr:hypothetical protein AciPR4_0958 [Terriglobus saanensis SP1PR4]